MICLNAWNSLFYQSHPPAMTAESLMEQRLSTVCTQQVFLPLQTMHRQCSFLIFEHQFQSTNRIDIVWDRYVSDSLKESTREKRGDGVRRKVSSQAKLPRNWMDFLRISQNKEDCFPFSRHKLQNMRVHQERSCISHQVMFSLNFMLQTDCNFTMIVGKLLYLNDYAKFHSFLYSALISTYAHSIFSFKYMI